MGRRKGISMSKTVIVCGMPQEKAVLTAALPGLLILSGTDKLHLPELVPTDCTRIVSMGLCGGLARLAPQPNDIGVIVAANKLVDQASDADYPDLRWLAQVQIAAATHQISIISCPYYSSGILDQADSAAQRAAIFAKYGTRAIDDESRYVAALAKQRGIPFNVLRSVSDDWSETLPLSATGAIMNKDGSADLGYLLWSLGQNQGAGSVDLFKIAMDFKKSLDALEAVAAAAHEVIAA